MYLYENAIIEDINKLFVNSKVTAMIADSLDDGLKKSAAKNDDVTTLPFIVLSGGDWVIDDVNFYNLMHGIEASRIKDNTLAKATNVIPFTPSYNIYIAAATSRECDMLTREIIFHYSMHPTLIVNIPYKINTTHTFNLIFDKNIRKTYRASGLTYRTISFTLDGAYLWHNNTMNVTKDVQTDVKTRIEGESDSV